MDAMSSVTGARVVAPAVGAACFFPKLLRAGGRRRLARIACAIALLGLPSVAQNNDPEYQRLPAGQHFQGTIEGPADARRFLMDGITYSHMKVYVTGKAGLKLVVNVFDPSNHQLISTASGSRAIRAGWTAPYTGSFLVSIEGVAGGGTGAFTGRTRASLPKHGLDLPVPYITNQGSGFTFTAAAGTRLSARLKIHGSFSSGYQQDAFELSWPGGSKRIGAIIEHGESGLVAKLPGGELVLTATGEYQFKPIGELSDMAGRLRLRRPKLSKGSGVIKPTQLCTPRWLTAFGSQPGTSSAVRGLTEFDDGTGEGPWLVAAGDFVTPAGEEASVIRWNGTSWSSVGGATDWSAGRAWTVASFDDGSGAGPELYAGGDFVEMSGVAATGIAKWDGSQWAALGSGLNGLVVTLLAVEEGVGSDVGPALYAGGQFLVSGVTTDVARWNGEQWLPLGSWPGTGYVYALAVHDDGSGGGPALFAGGDFTAAGGGPAARIAKWNGSGWSAVGTGEGGTVSALTVFDDGAGGGPALHAAGPFGSMGGTLANGVARWDGTTWSPLGGGLGKLNSFPKEVRALTVFDDGSGGGPALYVGGRFDLADGLPANRIAKWDGASWTPLGSGVGTEGAVSGVVTALAVHADERAGVPALCAGGEFQMAGGAGADNIAQWSNSIWSPVGNAGGINGRVSALAVLDDDSGAGEVLVAGGSFSSIGSVAAEAIAGWDGTHWSVLGSGLGDGSGHVATCTTFDDGSGSGPALYAGGSFGTAGGQPVNNVAKWDGANWLPLGYGLPYGFCSSCTPVGTTVRALTVFDDGSGSALYAGGSFGVAGGKSAHAIARWNGSQWSSVGGGLDSTVRSLVVFDAGDGSGPALYAAGDFKTARSDGGSKLKARHVARWNGKHWFGVGGGTDGLVMALAVFDDGSGPALYAGGEFTKAGGVKAGHIARWNGKHWSALGSGVDGRASGLWTVDDSSGGGPALFVGGDFTTAGIVAARNIAKWDGASWSALGQGLSGDPRCFALFDDGHGVIPELFVGGAFSSAPDTGDSFLVRWGCGG